MAKKSTSGTSGTPGVTPSATKPSGTSKPSPTPTAKPSPTPTGTGGTGGAGGRKK